MDSNSHYPPGFSPTNDYGTGIFNDEEDDDLNNEGYD